MPHSAHTARADIFRRLDAVHVELDLLNVGAILTVCLYVRMAYKVSFKLSFSTQRAYSCHDFLSSYFFNSDNIST